MQALKQFSILLQGLKIGSHRFDFDINDTFFTFFPDSPIEHGNLVAQADLDKKIDHLILDLNISGTIKTGCDRCTADINLPLNNSGQLIFKFTGEESGVTDENIVYLKPDENTLNISNYIYEYIVLAIPFSRVYDCESDEKPPCDTAVLARLSDRGTAETGEKAASENQFSELLKNLKLDKK